MKKRIAEMINKMQGGYTPYEIFTDWVELMALSICNTCHLVHDKVWQQREEQYLKIISKYNKKERYALSEMFNMLACMLEDNTTDALGEIYMEAGCGNKGTGQFFTPFNLLKLFRIIFWKFFKEINMFLNEDLSNWYIRRNRRRFWASENDTSKLAVYKVTYDILVGVCKLIAPIAPFVSEEIYTKLTGKESVHLSNYPTYKEELINEKIESRIETGLFIRVQASIENQYCMDKFSNMVYKKNGREITKMKINRMQLAENGPSVLRESIDSLRSSLQRKNAETVSSIDDLNKLINSMRK